MTVTGEPSSPLSTREDPSSSPGRRRDASAVRQVCPLLGVDDGSWRSAYAARDHHCHAVTPPAPLAVDKQRQLCLLPAHVSCATFIAARAVAEEAAPTAPGDHGAALWPTAGASTLVLEPARRLGPLPGTSARGGGQVLLVALMVVAFVVLLVARTQTPVAVAVDPLASDAAAVAFASASASPSARQESSRPSTTATSSPSADLTPAATVTPTAVPTTTPGGSSHRYRVRSGETLTSIAVRFNTTVRKLSSLNGISNPRSLKVGQVLQVP